MYFLKKLNPLKYSALTARGSAGLLATPALNKVMEVMTQAPKPHHLSGFIKKKKRFYLFLREHERAAVRGGEAEGEKPAPRRSGAHAGAGLQDPEVMPGAEARGSATWAPQAPSKV